jgi:hypothetical protein
VRGYAGIVLVLTAFFASSPAAAEDRQVDLELVLAIDASSSVDEHEWELQRAGYAGAFADARIAEAIVSGPRREIAVAIVVWADATVPRWESPWFALADSGDALRLSAFMAALPRTALGGTGIGAGIAQAIRAMERNGFAAPRQVVDVSGDGRETPPREVVVMMPMARALADAKGVTINGLAIINEDRDLAAWYRNNVITGRGAFVEDVADYEDFAGAIVKKLVREIRHQERLANR